MGDRDELESARKHGGLSVGALWTRYFALGGMSSPIELEAALFGALVPHAHDRDLIVLALNERYAELGLEQRLPYSDE